LATNRKVFSTGKTQPSIAYRKANTGGGPPTASASASASAGASATASASAGAGAAQVNTNPSSRVIAASLAKTLPTQAQGSGHRQKEAPGLSEPALGPPNGPLDKKNEGFTGFLWLACQSKW
jgi:hypothetical protein